MEHADVASLLKTRGEPEDKILLDDGEYFIKHNVNDSLTSGNGFLFRRCEIGRRFPGGEEAVGGYDLKLDGKWNEFNRFGTAAQQLTRLAAKHPANSPETVGERRNACYQTRPDS